MDYGAIDLHKKESQVRILAAAGTVIDQRIPTTRDRFTTLFWGRPQMRILVEASTESEWVAQHLEGLGHEVIVADPNFGLMYGHRSRRVKTDRRDVAALAEACRHGTYRPAHRRSAAQRTVQWHLSLRRELVDTRTRLIAIVRAITRSTGHRIPSGAAETFLRRLDTLALPEAIRASVAAVDPVLPIIDAEVAKVDAYLEALVDTDPRVQRLTTCPMIGPVTAVAFVAALDDVQRFAGRRGAAQVASYLGLAPREYSSGEHQQRGRVLRSAQPAVQALLVQAAWRVCRSTDPRTAALRTWARGIERRRGKKIAMVAVARRLARILYAMWRDGQDYAADRVRAHEAVERGGTHAVPA